MSIYKISYMSSAYRVYGYLGIPHDLDNQHVLTELRQQSDDVRIVEEIALSLPKDLGPAEQPNLGLTAYRPHGTNNINNINTTHDANDANKVNKTDISNATKYGVFVYCRGGINRVGKVRTWWIEEFLRHHTFVFAPCYRGSEGGEGRDEFGGADVEDVLSGIRILEPLSNIDAQRITVMGFSRGSINATATAMRHANIHSLVLWGGVADLSKTYEERVDLRRMLRRVVGGTPRRVPSEYETRSPIHMFADVHCPILIMHGTADVQVDSSHGLLSYDRLRELGKPVTFFRYEGLGHHLHPLIFSAVVSRMFAWIQEIPDSGASDSG